MSAESQKAAPILFDLFYPSALPGQLQQALGAEPGELLMRQFPDGETYLRLLSKVQQREVLVLANLHQPDTKFLPLIYLLRALRKAGAAHISLLLPYLPYMRQDQAFAPGELVTAPLFAALLGPETDALITVDPHLHRIAQLSDIYACKTVTLHADQLLAGWVRQQIRKPLLIGPDGESEQWVAQVAQQIGCPFLVLHKTRHGDRDVQISTPDAEAFKSHTPVLIDDIISTGSTMIETARLLQAGGLQIPVCIGVHAVFSADAWQAMQAAGIQTLVTCDSIPHPSNGISLAQLLAEGVRSL